MSQVPASNYVTFFNPAKAHHRAWLQAVLDRLVELDPKALDEGGELRDLWKVAVATKAPSPTPAAIPKLTLPAQQTTGLDPRGKEEEGLAGPKIKAPVKPGDSYLLVNDRDSDMEAYDHEGRLLWRVPCLARGVGGSNWAKRNSDTPPGLYKIGQIYRDYDANPWPRCSDDAQSYGWYSFDLEELEGQEAVNGRAGIMLHGGGSACGWPGAWAPKQDLYPTHGCVRAHNTDLRDKVLPLCKKGTVYVGVFQER